MRSLLRPDVIAALILSVAVLGMFVNGDKFPTAAEMRQVQAEISRQTSPDAYERELATRNASPTTVGSAHQ